MKKAGDFSQVILYAKGWFKKTDVLEDLKPLVAEAYLLPVEDMNASSIRDAMLHIATEFELINPDNFNRFMDDISPENFYRYTVNWSISHMCSPHPDYDYNTAVIRTVLSRLAQLKCMNGNERLILFKRPNFELLPRNENSKTEIDDKDWDDD